MSIAAFIKPVETKVGDKKVRLIRDDLTALAVDSIVHFSKENLDIGSGYGTGIQNRGGVSIRKELEKIGTLGMGEAAITGAGELSAKHIIHAVGPKFQEADVDGKLRACMDNALKVAMENGLTNVAFPPMGAGFYGIRLGKCSSIMLESIKKHLQGKTTLQEVIICTIDKRDFGAFKDKVEKL